MTENCVTYNFIINYHKIYKIVVQENILFDCWM